MRVKVPLTLMLVSLLTGTGCKCVEDYSLTYRLWSNGELSNWSEPAPDPKLALFAATNSNALLVEYDALSEHHSAVKRHAYWLQPNAARVEGGKKPKFTRSADTQHLRPIPVFTLEPQAGISTHASPVRMTFAVMSEEGRGFTLYQTNTQPWKHTLPIYPESNGTTVRVILTPLAVTGDTAMVSGLLVVVGTLAWLQMGAPIR